MRRGKRGGGVFIPIGGGISRTWCLSRSWLHIQGFGCHWFLADCNICCPWHAGAHHLQRAGGFTTCVMLTQSIGDGLLCSVVGASPEYIQVAWFQSGGVKGMVCEK